MPKTNLSNSTLILSVLVLISGVGICACILKQKDREI
jgi:lipoprotein